MAQTSYWWFFNHRRSAKLQATSFKLRAATHDLAGATSLPQLNDKGEL